MKKLIVLVLMVLVLEAKEVYATFSVAPQKSANLAFIVTGIVDKVNVDVGDKVVQNQVLSKLENSDLKALLDGAKANFEYAKREFERQKRVKDKISPSQFDAVKLKFLAAKAKYEYNQATLEKTYLKAPFNGVITYKDIERGDAINGMMLKTVFKIESDKNKKLIVKFDQKYVNSVKVGDKFKFKFAGSDKEYVGEIAKIYPTVDNKTNQATAEVYVKGFKSGMFGDGVIIIKN